MKRSATYAPLPERRTVTSADAACTAAAAALALGCLASTIYFVDRLRIGSPGALMAVFALAIVLGLLFLVPLQRIDDPRVRTWFLRLLSVPSGFLCGWYFVSPGFLAGSTRIIWGLLAVVAIVCLITFVVVALRPSQVAAVASVVGALMAASLFASLTTNGLLPLT